MLIPWLVESTQTNTRNTIRVIVVAYLRACKAAFMKKLPKSSKPVTSPVAVRRPIAAPTPASWTFLTNHSHVLLCLYCQPDQRLRDVALAVGITERMVQRIVAELADAGYLHIQKEGRCNRYTVTSDLQLRHPLEMQHTIGELLKVLSGAV